MTKVLIIRFSSIGDIVLCTPIMRCIKEQLGAEVHVLTKQGFASILEDNPHVDKVICYEALIESLDSLKKESYDHVVDLHNNLRSKKICRFLETSTYTLDKINLQKWLTVNLGLSRLPDIHIVNRKFNAIRNIGVEYDGKGLDFYYKADQALLANFPKTKIRIGIVLGAAHNTKRIPSALIRKIVPSYDAEYFLLGGPAETEEGKQLGAELGLVNWCGKTSLQGSAQLIDSCDLIISSDTGLMHIAAALDKRILVIWGSTIPEFGMYPFMKEEGSAFESSEVRGMHCRPCSKIGFEVCPKGHFDCMGKQSVPNIIGQIQTQLAGT